MGDVRVPPSKSLTNRYLNLTLLAARPVVLERPLDSDDTRRLAEALRALGFEVSWSADRLDLVPGDPPARAEIDCGLSGTMARFLTASLALLPGDWRLDGGGRLRERPLGPLVESLRGLGAEIECPEREGHLPLVIRGRPLEGGAVRLDASQSSQYLSALLMAGPRMRDGLRVIADSLVSAPYLDLTLAALESFGVAASSHGSNEWRVRPAEPEGGLFRVEADFSAGCYPAAAAVLTRGVVRLQGLYESSRQGDRRFFDLLERMGGRIAWERAGAMVKGGDPLVALEADLSEMPDQVPTLAALAPFAAGTTRIRNVPHLRLKESDRLAAMSGELRRLGIEVREDPDGLEIRGSWAVRRPPEEPVVVDAHGDHRIAMALALVGLRRPGVSVAGAAEVTKSYPSFWDDLEAGLRD